jgi:hypothetical protein
VTRVKSSFERCVFVNAPFDDDFLPLLHALLFTIHDCGFIARRAVEDTGASEMRIDKIVRIIRESCYSIHDISRVEGAGVSALPRFNMPFEAGLAVGATRFEPAGRCRRDFLVLDAEPFRDKRTLSDLAGQDPRIHHNDPEQVVGAVRRFLAAKSTGRRTRGATKIWERFQQFRADLPILGKALDISMQEMSSFDYLPEWTQVASQWVLSP